MPTPRYDKVVKFNARNPMLKDPRRAELVRAIGEAVAGEWSKRATWIMVERCVGYWMLWTQIPGGRAEIIDRGWMKRATAYAREAEFRALFGVPVEEFDPSVLPMFLFGPSAREGGAAKG